VDKSFEIGSGNPEFKMAGFNVVQFEALKNIENFAIFCQL
jgi:hypothetical protein